MILYGLLMTVYVFICLFLILIVLIQKGKSSMGIGAFGGSSQMLFGGSGGQDIFQKITWVLGTLFMASSLLLALMKSQHTHDFSYSTAAQPTQQQAKESPSAN